jgi:hypothetical protein
MAGFTIYQLTSGDGTGLAIHVAEVVGRSDEQLGRAVQEVMRHETEKQYIESETRTIIYSFVKHDTHRTRNFVIQIGGGAALGTLEANALVKAALAGRPLAGFLMQADGSLSPAVLQMPDVSLAHLAAFYAQ